MRGTMSFRNLIYVCKKGGKDQETIQSSTTPDQDTTWESNKNTINLTNIYLYFVLGRKIPSHKFRNW